MLDKHTQSYKNFLGREIVQEDNLSTPPEIREIGKNITTARERNGRVDSKDYAIYRNYYEGVMSQILWENNPDNPNPILKLTVACEGKDEKLRPIRLRKQKPEHYGCSLVYACHHCIHQDPVNPEGITFVPFKRNATAGFYVCKTCLKLFDNYKLDLDYSVCGKCSLCFFESVQQILKVKPDRFQTRADK